MCGAVQGKDENQGEVVQKFHLAASNLHQENLYFADCPPFSMGGYKNSRFSTVRGTRVKKAMEFYKAALKIVFVLQKNPTKFQQKKSKLQRKKPMKSCKLLLRKFKVMQEKG